MTSYKRSGDRSLKNFWPLTDRRSGSFMAKDMINFQDGTSNRPDNDQGIFGFSDSMNFDGINDMVSISNGSGQVYNNQTEFTVALWFKVDGANNADSLQFTLSHPATGGAGNRISMYINSDLSNISFHTVSTISAYALLKLGTWQHMAFTRNTSTGVTNYYIDGKWVDSKTIAAGSTDLTTLLFGRFNTSSADALNGNVAKVRFYDRVLSASEIASLYRKRR